MTRRQLAAAVASIPAAPLTGAQAAPAEDLAKLAREQVRRNSELLAKRAIPMATEPAFVFKA